LLLGCAVAFGGLFWLGIVPFCMTLALCLTSALRARVAAPFQGWGSTLLITFLIYVGPLIRTLERYRWRLRRFREVKPFEFNGPRQAVRILWYERAFYLSYWNERGQEKESLLHAVMDFLLPRKYLIAMDQGWSQWDLEICQGPWAKAQIRAATENHGGAKRLLRVRCALRMSRISLTCLCLYLTLLNAAAFFSMPRVALAALVIGLIHGGAILYQKFRLGRALYHVLESLAHKLDFVPVRQSSEETL
jgi:O-antigen biosynthesis protein